MKSLMPTIPNFKIPSFEIPKKVIEEMQKDNAINRGFANVLYIQLMRQIAEYEKTLNPDEEIAAYLASFGREIIIQIDKVSYQDPYFILFEGVVNDSSVRLIQHVSQLNVLFTSVKVKDMSRTPRRIGFIVEDEEK